MTKKDYTNIRNAIKTVRESDAYEYETAYFFDNLVSALADIFSVDNPRFDRIKWLKSMEK